MAKKVGDWLQSIGEPYAQYHKAFSANCLTGSAVLALTDEALKELGVKSLVHRIRLIALSPLTALRPPLTVPLLLLFLLHCPLE